MSGHTNVSFAVRCLGRWSLSAALLALFVSNSFPLAAQEAGGGGIILPDPCALKMACVLVDGHVVIRVIPEGDCQCREIAVVRDDGEVIPSLDPPFLFRDPKPCSGVHTYVARCLPGGPEAKCTIECPPCKIEDLACAFDEAAGLVRLKWTTTVDGCCDRFVILRNGAPIDVVPGTERTYAAKADCKPGQVIEFCVVCLDGQGLPVSRACCRVECPCPERRVHDLRCVNLAPLAVGVKLVWSVDTDCPCRKVAIFRDGVFVDTAEAAAGEYIDLGGCPASGPCVEVTYCIVCLDEEGNPAGPRVCCTLRCGDCDCREPSVRDLTCAVKTLDTGDRIVVLQWETDPNCNCKKVRIYRDGEVIFDGEAPAGGFIDKCRPGIHEYCVVCLGPDGEPAGPRVCCRVECPCDETQSGVESVACEHIEAEGVVKVSWTLKNSCPCRKVAIFRDGVMIGAAEAALGVFVDPTTCKPEEGPCVERVYCVVCLDEDGEPVGERVCCRVRCGRCDCVDPHVKDLTCQIDRTAAGEIFVAVKWAADADCPCDKVRLLRDGVVIFEGSVVSGFFRDPCTPGRHEYCIVCLDEHGEPAGPRVCCEVECPEETDCRLEMVCVVREGKVIIRVLPSGPECCEKIVVTRDDGAGIPAVDPVTFVDPEPCRKGFRTYTAKCVGGLGDGACAACSVHCRMRGDANLDFTIDVSDAIAALTCLFLDGATCLPCMDVLDCNHDGTVDLTDPVGILLDLFQGGHNMSEDPVDCPE